MHTNSLMSLSNVDVFNNVLTDSLKNATLVGKLPTVKTFIFTLEKDSLVSPNNTRAYLEPLGGNPLVSNITFDNFDHEVCLLGPPSQLITMARSFSLIYMPSGLLTSYCPNDRQ